MRKFGLIGYPLGHSFSKTYFTKKFLNEKITDAVYNNYPIENIDQLRVLLEKDRGLVGLNVTIPYKLDVCPYLDEIDSEAREVGAVNTIKILRKEGSVYLKGFNTDIYGFERPLMEVLKPIHSRALILGTGGAARAVAYILKKHGIQFTYVSRSPKNRNILSYDDLTNELVDNHKLIVNTSPAGMHPILDTCPDIPYSAITGSHILYDLIYNPERTLFLEKGGKKEATLINGLPMLYLQAEKSWQIWNT